MKYNPFVLCALLCSQIMRRLTCKSGVEHTLNALVPCAIDHINRALTLLAMCRSISRGWLKDKRTFLTPKLYSAARAFWIGSAVQSVLWRLTNRNCWTKQKPEHHVVRSKHNLSSCQMWEIALRWWVYSTRTKPDLAPTGLYRTNSED